VEVAVFVAVIFLAILVAFFALRGQGAAREREATVNNLRQWGIALNLYLIDSRNVLPLAGSRENLEDEQAWFNALPPYLSQPMLKELAPGELPRIGRESLWVNPAARDPQPKEIGEKLFTYGMNAWLSPAKDRFYKIYQIENPMAVVFLSEIEGYDPNVTADDVRPRFGASSLVSPEATAHFLFVDGHVAAAPRSEFLDDPDASDSESPSEKFTWVPFRGASAPE